MKIILLFALLISSMGCATMRTHGTLENKASVLWILAQGLDEAVGCPMDLERKYGIDEPSPENCPK